MDATTDRLLEQILDELRRMRKAGQSSAPTPAETARAYALEKARGSAPVGSHQIHTIDSGATLSSVQGSAAGDSLTLTVEKYLASLTAMTWTPQHLKAVEYTLLNFEAWAAGLQMEEVTPQVMREYRVRSQESLAPKTVNNHLAIISSFFIWAQEQGVVGRNPAENLALRIRTRRSSQRKAFTSSQLSDTLAPLVAGTWATKGLKCWIPLIMAYSGARPEEIAQLRCHDVRQASLGNYADNTTPLPGNSGWVFDFETEENGQRRKSEASRRLVPVHPRLIELGFLELAAGRCGDDLLWPQNGSNGRGRLSENASRWFNRSWLRSHCGITDPKLVLYSIRHTVATRLKHEGVDECMIAQLLGHEHPEITNGRYGKDYPISQLSDALTHLRWGI
jgi:integrase